MTISQPVIFRVLLRYTVDQTAILHNKRSFLIIFYELILSFLTFLKSDRSLDEILSKLLYNFYRLARRPGFASVPSNTDLLCRDQILRMYFPQPSS